MKVRARQDRGDLLRERGEAARARSSDQLAASPERWLRLEERHRDLEDVVSPAVSSPPLPPVTGVLHQPDSGQAQQGLSHVLG